MRNLPDLGPTVIDIFSGCGGTITGFKMAGFCPMAGIEINPIPAKVAQLNHPTTEVIVADVRDVDPSQVELSGRQVDVLTACPPCQGFSVVNQKRNKAKKDLRDSLILQIPRFAKALAPQIILVENVPAFLKSFEFAAAKEQLANLGYQAVVKTLNAKDFGIPQHRQRAIALFARDIRPHLPAGLFSNPRKDGEQNLLFAETTNPYQTVRDAIGKIVVPDQQEWLHNQPRKTSALVRERIAAVPHDGGNRADLPKHLRLRCHANVRGFNNVYGRMWWNKPAPTLTCYFDSPGCGRFIHPNLDRAITAYEGLILQGFPKSYQFDKSISLGHIVSMIGEAFPPRWVAQLATHIRKMLQMDNRDLVAC